MALNFLDLRKETDIQVQETQKVPNKMNPKRTTSRYFKITVIKIKGKERILKTARENQRVIYKGCPPPSAKAIDWFFADQKEVG